MKCDLCDQEATVQEIVPIKGKLVERHLCEECARTKGITTKPTISVPELIEKYLQHAQETSKGATKATSCPSCGTTYVEFRQCMLLGCSECYKAFESQLGSLLERAHEGGTHHVGKLPRRALSDQPGAASPRAAILGDATLRAGRITALRRQLDDAVRAEQYEQAAALRDELRRMTELDVPPEPGPRTA
jgi:protein arginine kinase activator